MDPDSASLAIGIDVDTTRITGLLATSTGHIIAQAEAVPTPHSTPQDVVNAITSMARTLREASVDAPVGVCIPGCVDESRGVSIQWDDLGWKEAPLAQLLTQSLSSPVSIGGTASSQELAQTLWGVDPSSSTSQGLGAAARALLTHGTFSLTH